MSDLLQNLNVQGVGMTSLRTRERLVQRLADQGVESVEVLELMRRTPRHLFLDEALAHRAYEDTALPIGFGQTLSQPYSVAKMTEILLRSAKCLDRVLEIGTGSGYQTAVLAPLVGDLYTVERIKPLQERARRVLRQLELYNIHFHHADGGLGWPSQGPFDAILSAAAPSHIPDDLKKQLAPGGVLVIPVGKEQQTLVQVTHNEDGSFTQKALEPVCFVPLLQGVVR